MKNILLAVLFLTFSIPAYAQMPGQDAPDPEPAIKGGEVQQPPPETPPPPPVVVPARSKRSYKFLTANELYPGAQLKKIGWRHELGIGFYGYREQDGGGLHYSGLYAPTNWFAAGIHVNGAYTHYASKNTRRDATLLHLRAAAETRFIFSPENVDGQLWFGLYAGAAFFTETQSDYDDLQSDSGFLLGWQIGLTFFFTPQISAGISGGYGKQFANGSIDEDYKDYYNLANLNIHFVYHF